MKPNLQRTFIPTVKPFSLSNPSNLRPRKGSLFAFSRNCFLENKKKKPPPSKLWKTKKSPEIFTNKFQKKKPLSSDIATPFITPLTQDFIFKRTATMKSSYDNSSFLKSGMQKSIFQNRNVLLCAWIRCVHAPCQRKNRDSFTRRWRGNDFWAGFSVWLSYSNGLMVQKMSMVRESREIQGLAGCG